MDFEKYTDRSRGFVQAAQSLAQREGHQQFAPEHLLKVLLDDPEGLAAGLIDRAGGNSRGALSAVEAALAKRPSVSGGGAVVARERGRAHNQGEKRPECDRCHLSLHVLISGLWLKVAWLDARFND